MLRPDAATFAGVPRRHLPGLAFPESSVGNGDAAWRRRRGSFRGRSCYTRLASILSSVALTCSSVSAGSPPLGGMIPRPVERLVGKECVRTIVFVVPHCLSH